MENAFSSSGFPGFKVVSESAKQTNPKEIIKIIYIYIHIHVYVYIMTINNKTKTMS